VYDDTVYTFKMCFLIQSLYVKLNSEKQLQSITSSNTAEADYVAL